MSNLNMQALDDHMRENGDPESVQMDGFVKPMPLKRPLTDRMRNSAQMLEVGIVTGHDWPNTQGELDRMNGARLLRDAAAEIDALRVAAKAAQVYVPLRAHGVLDADDNLDCWDTPPFELANHHVAALNAKDPAAMWRVDQLYVLRRLVPAGVMKNERDER